MRSAGRSIKFRKPAYKSLDVILSILRILRTYLKGFTEKLELIEETQYHNTVSTYDSTDSTVSYRYKCGQLGRVLAAYNAKIKVTVLLLKLQGHSTLLRQLM